MGLFLGHGHEPVRRRRRRAHRRAGRRLLRPPPLSAAGRRSGRLSPRNGTTGDRRAESHLFWPSRGLSRRSQHPGGRLRHVPGGPVRAALAARQVVGIDVSANSLQFTAKLKRKYGLDNLELRRLPVERAAELGATLRPCGLHRRAAPSAGPRRRPARAARCAGARRRPAPDGLCALWPRRGLHAAGLLPAPGHRGDRREIARPARQPEGAAAGSPAASRSCARRPTFARRRAWPTRCCIRRTAPIRSRSYSTSSSGPACAFGRWIRQAPYLAGMRRAGGVAPPAAPRPARPRASSYAAVELFRGTMVRHSPSPIEATSRARRPPISFAGDALARLCPAPLAGDHQPSASDLPPGAAAVLINQAHTYADLYLPIDEKQDRLLAGVDGRRTIGEIASSEEHRRAARLSFSSSGGTIRSPSTPPERLVPPKPGFRRAHRSRLWQAIAAEHAPAPGVVERDQQRQRRRRADPQGVEDFHVGALVWMDATRVRRRNAAFARGAPG